VSPTARVGGTRATILVRGDRTQKIPDGVKSKDLLGVPWRLAFALRDAGWYLRQDIIWHKPNAMPESVTDRCTKAHEYVFMLTKKERYYFDIEVLKEPAVGKSFHDLTGGTYKAPGQALQTGRGVPDGRHAMRQRRSIWNVNTAPFPGAHFATFPPALVEPMVLATSRPGDAVLDPFCGSGTTGIVALKHGRHFMGIELNPEYVTLAHARIAGGV
jgi:DNA modification methylase